MNDKERNFISSMSKEQQLAELQKDGMAIRFINSPTEEMQLAAVKQNGLAIQFIKYPSEAVQSAAIKQNSGEKKYIGSIKTNKFLKNQNLTYSENTLISLTNIINQ